MTGGHRDESLTAIKSPAVVPHSSRRLALEVWDPKLTVACLRAGRITQREQCEAVIILLALFYLGVSLRLYAWPEPLSVESAVRYFLDPLGLCCAMVVSYRVNRMHDNADFCIRAMCLLVPVYVRVVFLFFVVLIVWHVIGLALYGEAFDEVTKHTTWSDVGLVATMYACVVWRLAVHMALVAQPDRSSEPVCST